ncbi:hypothetical protein [Haliangium ochraceum]|uniref:Uncharacterized protein n=1 Tax=Haliangium ochraceum (strain DSM 14365 / JCM 11303 / SMP-2) TaxID=502025 RepID=D0LY08_HALO1|nr:hypothetical protein [Haliangium ochraceum]ACY14363.1 hypothetical protein Hoch_1815 [Haliangium ochraceum DSM 14365]
MSAIEQRILEELVYDRVRTSVNLCQLVIIEQELDDSIRRALDSASGGGAGGGDDDDDDDDGIDERGGDGIDERGDSDALGHTCRGVGARPGRTGAASATPVSDRPSELCARAHMQRAWRRLEREWRDLRGELGHGERG